MAAVDEFSKLPLEQRVEQIPTGPRSQTPAPERETSFFRDSELGRNIHNAAMALPGAGPALQGARLAATGARAIKALASPVAAAATAPATLAYGVPAAATTTLMAAAAPDAPPPKPGSPGAPGAAKPAAAPGAGRQPVTAPPVVAAPTGQPPAVPQLTGATGSEVAGAPGVQKFQQGGRTLYSNVSGSASNDALMTTKGAVNQGAAATLANTIDPGLAAARRAAIERGDIDSVAASFGGNFNTGAPAAAGPAATVLSGQVNGLRLANQERPELVTQGLSQRQIARNQLQQMELEQRAATAGAQMDVQSAGDQLRAQVTREGQALQAGTAAAQLAQAGPVQTADARLKTSQAAAQSAISEAQQAVLRAKNPEQRQAAEDVLRSLQGRAANLDGFATTVVPGEVDALGNKSPSRLAVTNKGSGAVTVYGSDGQPVQAVPKGLPMPKSKAELVTGKAYTNAAGQTMQWNGERFVPIQ